MDRTTLGYALCGSFCTFSKTLPQMKKLKDLGYNILPIFSYNAYNTDTRFGKASKFIEEVEDICQNKIIHTIEDAEPIGPKKLTDLMIIAPCTGNTMAKLSNGITDTPVTMAVKSHLRSGRNVLVSLATNDALGASAQNIGKLLNTKNYYFVPISQDNPKNKPNSLVAHFDLIPQAVEFALQNIQLQPIFR